MVWIRTLLNAAWALLFWVRRGFPIIYCNSLRDRITCLLIPPRFLLTHVRDYPKPGHVRILRLLRSRYCLVSSEFMASVIRPQLSYPTVHIPNIIIFPHESLTKAIPAAPFRILTVANLIPWKRHELAILAVMHLREQGHEIVLDMYGTDPLGENPDYAGRIRRMVGARNDKGISLIEDRILTSEIYSQYHCLLHTAENEPFGRVIVEALGASCPAVVHDSGEPPNLVRKYEGGVVFQDVDPTVIGQSILALQRDYQSHTTLLRGNIDRIRKEFSAHWACDALRECGKMLSGLAIFSCSRPAP